MRIGRVFPVRVIPIALIAFRSVGEVVFKVKQLWYRVRRSKHWAAASFSTSFFETLGKESAKWLCRVLAVLVLKAAGVIDGLIRIVEQF